MGITVYDLLQMFISPEEQHVVLVDLKDGDVVEIFDGEFGEMSDEYQELEIQSIDNIYNDPSCYGKIVINVDTSEMG